MRLITMNGQVFLVQETDGPFDSSFHTCTLVWRVDNEGNPIPGCTGYEGKYNRVNIERTLQSKGWV